MCIMAALVDLSCTLQGAGALQHVRWPSTGPPSFLSICLSTTFFKWWWDNGQFIWCMFLGKRKGGHSMSSQSRHLGPLRSPKDSQCWRKNIDEVQNLAQTRTLAFRQVLVSKKKKGATSCMPWSAESWMAEIIKFHHLSHPGNTEGHNGDSLKLLTWPFGRWTIDSPLP